MNKERRVADLERSLGLPRWVVLKIPAHADEEAATQSYLAEHPGQNPQFVMVRDWATDGIPQVVNTF